LSRAERVSPEPSITKRSGHRSVEFIFIERTSTKAAIEPAATAWIEIFHQRLIAVTERDTMNIPAMNVLIKTGTGYLIII